MVCPVSLREDYMDALPGFEPGSPESKAGVLPLDERATNLFYPRYENSLIAEH
jgi:hypothetical protein